MSYFGIPIRNGLMLGLAAVMSLGAGISSLVAYYLVTEGGDNLVTEADERILLEQDYG
jgi:hypothetical protein